MEFFRNLFMVIIHKFIRFTYVTRVAAVLTIELIN